MVRTRMPAPRWFYVVAVILLLWGAAGCWACVEHIRFGAQGIEVADEYERRFYLALPAWFDLIYAIAVLGGFLGSAALLLRSRMALGFYGASLVAVVVQFGWTFLATDLLAVKGVATTVPFPVVIALVALFQLWLARRAKARGWIA